MDEVDEGGLKGDNQGFMGSLPLSNLRVKPAA